jgi:hypothetical protein
MPIAAEVAARCGKVLTRKAAAESPARTAEMADPAAHMSATTEPTTVSTPAPPPPRANASAVSPPVRAAAVAKTIMVLRNIGCTPSNATGVHSSENIVTIIGSDCANHSDPKSSAMFPSRKSGRPELHARDRKTAQIEAIQMKSFHLPATLPLERGFLLG